MHAPLQDAQKIQRKHIAGEIYKRKKTRKEKRKQCTTKTAKRSYAQRKTRSAHKEQSNAAYAQTFLFFLYAQTFIVIKRNKLLYAQTFSINVMHIYISAAFSICVSVHNKALFILCTIKCFLPYAQQLFFTKKVSLKVNVYILLFSVAKMHTIFENIKRR